MLALLCATLAGLLQGRFFDGHVLDMVELGLSNFVGLEEIPGPKKRIGSIPCFLFIGDEWDRNPTCGRLRSLVLGAWALPPLRRSPQPSHFSPFPQTSSAAAT